MNIIFVLIILSLILALRTIVILKEIIVDIIDGILEFIKYVKNNLFRKYITVFSISIIIHYNNIFK